MFSIIKSKRLAKLKEIEKLYTTKPPVSITFRVSQMEFYHQVVTKHCMSWIDRELTFKNEMSKVIADDSLKHLAIFNLGYLGSTNGIDTLAMLVVPNGTNTATALPERFQQLCLAISLQLDTEAITFFQERMDYALTEIFELTAEEIVVINQRIKYLWVIPFIQSIWQSKLRG